MKSFHLEMQKPFHLLMTCCNIPKLPLSYLLPYLFKKKTTTKKKHFVPSNSLFLFAFPFITVGKILIFPSKQTSLINANSLSESQLQRPDLPATWKQKQHVSPGPSPQSKHSCVEYFPHSSVHLRVIRAQLAPGHWVVNRPDYQSKPPLSERLEYELLTTEAVDACGQTGNSGAKLKCSLKAPGLTECLEEEKTWFFKSLVGSWIVCVL